MGDSWFYALYRADFYFALMMDQLAFIGHYVRPCCDYLLGA